MMVTTDVLELSSERCVCAAASTYMSKYIHVNHHRPNKQRQDIKIMKTTELNVKEKLSIKDEF